MMTKKSKIKKLIEDAFTFSDGSQKTISMRDMREAGLCPNKEFGEKWCDSYLVARIAKQEGWRALIGGHGIHLFKK